MRRFSTELVLVFVLVLVGLEACTGTTGSGLVSFPAVASGTAGVTSTTTFSTPLGFAVKLSRARLHIGAAYLTASVANASDQSCVEPGRYVGEVPGPVDVDVLSIAPQSFTVAGDGTEDQALTGEVWLTGGDVDAPEDSTVILDLAGTASRAGATFPFQAKVTIGSNRAMPATDPAQPGLNPMCKRRIVSPIPIDLTLSPAVTLRLGVDPRPWFNTVDFRRLDVVTTSPPLYQIPDSDDASTIGATAGWDLFLGLRASSGVYTFTVQATMNRP